MLDQNYSKTEAGREEIKSRSLPLSRSARNLLLVMDASKPARQWLALVQGVGEQDLALLLEKGLVAAQAGGVRATARAPEPAAELPAPKAEAPNPPAGADVARLYSELYAYLTAQAPRQLGLMKGYVFTLELEQCQDLPALRKLAADLLVRVQQAKGPAAAQELREGMVAWLD
ncbi:MAG: hypothetical protein ACK4S6_04320 [Roseateles asaccharophilus]|uniref:Uncharacterized protein n=1 Tax=Roseateles asaccharophilus TaxID=582607 RepID=A0A4R6NCC1_9BURK|nr:hypothetical protein [Roseateles asaccharophilus]MDN3542989.1 hypothetical protein [Roseateles asaccharophilus]TDP13311.1 hypothetical protein DFR39_101786 [Roseateles asaccharophilus]